MDPELVAWPDPQGTTEAGYIARIWLTPHEGYLHLSYKRGAGYATTEPVTTDQVPGVLASSGVEAKSWVRWQGPLHDQNPPLDPQQS